MNANDQQEIRSIQLKCLEILDEVDRICRKYDIAYSLCGGSVVGAHLYSGCLPWDDDIDLMMTRENYNRFLSAAKQELPNYYLIQNYNTTDDYYTLFTKIVDTRTTLVQKTDAKTVVSGVFLDITVYDKISENALVRSIDLFLWKLSQWCLIGKMNPTSIKNIVRNSFISLMGTPPTRYFRLLQWVLEKNEKAKNYTYSEFFGSFCNTKPYSKEIFENYAEVSFEGKQYMIVRDYVDYLVCRYERTDFREPKEKQVPSHYDYVDLNLPYRDYCADSYGA